MNAQELAQTTHEHPSLQVDRLLLSGNRTVFVVRDDLLPAGTKQRAILPLLRDLIRAGARHVTYASPFAGFAQVALAYGCHALKVPCTLYCERDLSQDGMRAHSFTALAEQWGAMVVLVDSLAAAERQATEFAEAKGAFKIPLGFQCREFQRHFQEAVANALVAIRIQIGGFPTRVWLPVGSGTLAHAFHKMAPINTQLCCVDVHVLEKGDFRLQSLRSLPRIQYFSANEEFRERASYLPPVPSNLHYDAKVWAFVAEFAKDGDLWWNVAR